MFNNGGLKGAGKAALIDGIQNGAITLDAYAGHLTDLYHDFGFKPVARMPFNDEFAPPNWDYANLGRPDVIHMAHTGGDRNTIAQRIGTFGAYEPPKFTTTDWDAAHAAARSEAVSAEAALSASHRGFAAGAVGARGQSVAATQRAYIHPATPLTYEWTLTGEQCGTPAALWRQSGVSVAWSHSDQNPDSCEHKGTNHAVVAKVVVTTPTWLVTCTIDGSENKVIDYPKCEEALNTAPAPGAASATPTRTPAR